MAVPHATKYRAAQRTPQPVPAAYNAAGFATGRDKKAQFGKAGKHAGSKRVTAGQALESGEKLWKKIIAWCILVCAPGAAMALLVFVWQLNGALEHVTAADTGPVAQNTALTPLLRDKSAAAANKPSDVAGNRLTFIQRPPMAAGQTRQNRAYSADLRFLHTGLIYSSFLVLIASLCIALLLVRFMVRDKHRRHAYQTLLANSDTALESRVRHRTAHLAKARHLAEKERQRAELLLQDTSHRVGNSLATISSLLGLQLRQCHDKQGQKALLSARDRIQTISAAHRRLRLGRDMETASVGEFLSAVIHDIENGLSAAQRRHITIESRFEPCFLPARDVTTLGIILGELVINAVKHAFPDGRRGKITVTFGKLNGKSLHLIVEDDGIGLPPALRLAKTAEYEQKGEPGQGLGRLIISQLAAQFNARPQFSNSAKGGSRIIIPLLNSQAENKKFAAKKAAA
ncbi:MAG: sensor histidine kinase [Candidatus Tokpelaia sp.]|nr:MAG: sensor histidine kinase [Candidatus Tokpelaia sp.]KAA6207031.1 MAG: sensor histidine kinase [Candidatus Tokpelaia sp.]